MYGAIIFAFFVYRLIIEMHYFFSFLNMSYLFYFKIQRRAAYNFIIALFAFANNCQNSLAL